MGPCTLLPGDHQHRPPGPRSPVRAVTTPPVGGGPAHSDEVEVSPIDRMTGIRLPPEASSSRDW